MPFRHAADDYFDMAIGFALIAFFFFSVVLTQGVLTEAVDDSGPGHTHWTFTLASM